MIFAHRSTDTMKFVLKYIQHYKVRAILAPLLKLSEVVLELFVPLIVAAIIDRGIGGGDRAYIVRMCVTLIVLALLGVLVAVLAQYFAAGAAVGFATELRMDLFSHIMKFSYTAQDAWGKEKLITRLTSDVLKVQNGVNMTLRLFLRSPFVVVGAMVMAFTVDVKSALVFLAVIPALSVVIVLLIRVTLPMYARTQSRLDGVLSKVRSDVDGARVIRAFSLEALSVSEFEEKNSALYKAQLTASRISAFQNPLTLVMINLATIYLIYQGAIRVDIGVLSQGQVVALVNYMSQILVELVKFANAVIMLAQAISSGKRIQEVLQSAPDIPAALPKTEDAGVVVKLEHVFKRYHSGAQDAVADISMEIRKGELIGVIGSTGSGKTTLINLAAGFYEPDRGTVSRSGTLGIAPQKAVLFSGTVRDNMRWANPQADDETIWEALRIAVADEIIRNTPGQLDAEVQRLGSNFSGGQRQRLGIARAVIAGAELLILDDSASALDYGTEKKLRENLRTIPGEPAILWVSQRISSIRNADRIYVLEDGRIVGCGTHEALLADCGAYREIYDSQS